ncbi:radical SAM protein [Thalassococcus sp. BH17M4-6]|uniref:radical SAM protein n=1 Tax=Thalassococcus sp. BH17M4-6 TaxID=3413148 RepID=UPI003BBE7615
MPPRQNLTYVVKLSKFCNLRCRYCYEFSQLGDKTRMSPHLLARLFNFMRGYSALNNAWTRIIWHGGEPLALPERYWADVDTALGRVFGHDLPDQAVQTNLFSLTDWRIDRLRRIGTVGVSFDVHPGERRAMNGKTSELTVLANMDRLRADGVEFGCISVAHRGNLDKLDQTFAFYNAARTGFRILPFYRSDNPGQVDSYGLTPAEVVTLYSRLFDLWLTEGDGIQIEPISRYVEIAMRHITGKKAPPFNKRRAEKVVMIDTDGTVYSNANAYRKGYAYGNVLTDSADKVHTSPGRARDVAEAEARVSKTCRTCPYFGACDGFFMAEATPHEPQSDCALVRPTLDHITASLRRFGRLKERLALHDLPPVDDLPITAVA